MKKLLLSCFLLMACLFGIPQAVSAQETGFLTPGESTFLYLDTRILNETYDNEPIKFVLQQDGVLRLLDYRQERWPMGYLRLHR